jgi:Divergent InlB B-repeat domain
VGILLASASAGAATARDRNAANVPEDISGARSLSGNASSAVLPRATIDRPDDVAGPQVHVIYALPSDGADRALDQSGTLDGSVASWNAWLATQTGGRNFRLDTSNRGLDITFVRLAQTDAQIEANGVYARDELERQLHGLGFNQPQKIYAVYYDGRHSFTCGDGPWPPDLPGNVVALYLHGLYSGPRPCDTNPWGSVGRPGYLEFAMVHEVVHALGFVPTCAPHHTRRGHVSDSPSDLMYAGSAPWSPTTLDVGHDDYYNAHIQGCPDLSDSPYLVSLHSVSVSVTGPGKVASSPAGIDCPDACTGTFPGSVTLTATPSAGAVFDGWAGACSGTTPTCVISGEGSASASFSASSHRRTLTLRARAQRAKGVLSVVDGYEQCRVHAPVVVERRGKRSWSIIRRARTDKVGLFAVPIPKGRATYRARAPETTVEGQTCVKTVSRTVATSR